MKGGDMNLETQTDMLRFTLKTKPHKALDFGTEEAIETLFACFVYGKQKMISWLLMMSLRFLSVMDAICTLQKS